MSNKGMPDSVKGTWALVQKWRDENGGKWPKAGDIHEMHPDMSMGRLNDHFTYLRRHRFIPTDSVTYQDAKRKRIKDNERYKDLMEIARELRNKGHG